MVPTLPEMALPTDNQTPGLEMFQSVYLFGLLTLALILLLKFRHTSNTFRSVQPPIASSDAEPAKAARYNYLEIYTWFNEQAVFETVPISVVQRVLHKVEYLLLVVQTVLALRLLRSSGNFALHSMLLSVLYVQLFLVRFVRSVYQSSAASNGGRASLWFRFSAVFYLLIWPYHVILAFLHHEPSIVVCNSLLIVTTTLLTCQNLSGNLLFRVCTDSRACSEPLCSIFHTLTYWWIDPLLQFASTKSQIHEKDLWGLVKMDYAINQITHFKQLTQHNLTSRLFVNFRPLFVKQLLCGVVCSALVFTPTVLLQRFLDYVAAPSSIPATEAWLMIVLMFLMKIMESMLSSYALYLGKRIDIRLKTILINEIYAKAMSMKINSSHRTGSVLNLISSDAYNIGLTVGYLNTLPTSAIMIVIALTLLYRNLGWSALVGALVMVGLIPLNYKTASTIGTRQKRVLANMDERISQLNEIFANIRTIKNFAWEDKFHEEVMATRSKEMANLKSKSLFWCVQNLLSSVTPTLVTFGAFFCYTMVQGQTLTTSLAFTSLTLFNLLRQPLIDLSAWSSDLMQAHVSLKRISAFLESEETAKYTLSSSKNSAFECNGLTFSWGDGQFSLNDVNIQFKPNKLNVIVGATGSGKTSLLLALLGEMPLVNGHVQFPGLEPIAYCSQTPWLVNDSIKNNILYHSKFDPVRYEQVVEACGLKQDLRYVSEDTEIGESGVALSGGQKQRLALARAVYSHSRYVVLDDCLSAVDAHTSLWVYEHCLAGDIMRNRTCILASHNVSLALTKADWVVVLDAGSVVDQGNVADLMLRNALAGFKARDLNDEDKVSGGGKLLETPLPERVQLVSLEHKAQGSIPWHTYGSYARDVGGKYVWVLICVLYLVSQLVSILQILWLRKWTASEGQSLYFVCVYFAIGVGFSLCNSGRVLFVFWRGLQASNSIFSKSFTNILKAKPRFFDITPKGRIINRFSKDVLSVDQELIRYGETTAMYLLQCASTILMICLVTPPFLLFVVFIVASYYWLARKYLSLSRELKRLDSTTRSPVYSQFQETLNGMVTIRSFTDELRYLKRNLLNLDQNNKAYYYLWISNRWLSVRTDAVGAFILLLAGSFIILNVTNIDAGLAGLSLTYAITFNSFAVWLIRSYVNVEMSMNSIERLHEYLQVDQEGAPWCLESDKHLDPSWPSQGAIQFQNLSLRYSPESEPVIKNVTFEVQPGEKVAIVGRTGAGKSTVISALFRTVEPDQGGLLLIDGVDIQTIGLQKLRRSVSIIPQDPTLFTGTIRSNLDPFHDFSDEQLVLALVKVNMAQKSDNCSEIVERTIAENGSNLSQGQKQLLCMARALLRDSKIILLDEATSSTDHQTDQLIQDTIRTSFCGSTVITIAHRLNSIIDYDRILVLEKGRVLEYDTPARLLQNDESMFTQLCQMSGEWQELKHRAGV